MVLESGYIGPDFGQPIIKPRGLCYNQKHRTNIKNKAKSMQRIRGPKDLETVEGLSGPGRYKKRED